MSITETIYAEKYQHYTEQKQKIKDKLATLDRASEEYYITATYILNLASKAHTLFKSSKVDEKRLLLYFVLSNCVLDGDKLRYDLKKPFDSIFSLASRQQWLPRLDSNQRPAD